MQDEINNLSNATLDMLSFESQMFHLTLKGLVEEWEKINNDLPPQEREIWASRIQILFNLCELDNNIVLKACQVEMENQKSALLDSCVENNRFLN